MTNDDHVVHVDVNKAFSLSNLGHKLAQIGRQWSESGGDKEFLELAVPEEGSLLQALHCFIQHEEVSFWYIKARWRSEVDVFF
jgi:hypothetical protein